ncbi:hypothetical protein TWF106_007402 [Orbilia oligospora]|uniref:BTB domain-containing protein n=1 Tax=Orbilia oligospora TaxID=2813651 RepID=A0A7C8R2S8_ORBOL|nr:hypothetical protein TWF106_007402 [Orbilia oligospora]
MTEEINHVDCQKFFKSPEYADVLVTLGLEPSGVLFPMHQIIICTKSEYFKQACSTAKTSGTGTKLLRFDMRLEAFQIIAAWVYGYGEESFKSQTDTQVIREALADLEAFDMTQFQEMEELRVLLMKYLFHLELNVVASGKDEPKTTLEVLEDICAFSFHNDRKMLVDFVKKNIPELRASDKWLDELNLRFTSATALVASILIEIYQEDLNQHFCNGCRNSDSD